MKELLDRYRGDFASLAFAVPSDGVLEVIIANEGRQNSATEAMHRDLANVWRAIDADTGVRAVLVRGEGEHFSSGGDFAMIERMIEDEATLLRVWREASDLVYNLVDCSKPVVSAIRGTAVGAGLAVALLADVSVAGQEREDSRWPHAPRRRGRRPRGHPLAAAVRPRKGALLPADQRAPFRRGGRAHRAGLVVRGRCGGS